MQLPLYRVVVEARGEKNLVAVGPAMIKPACEKFADAIATQIAAGKEKRWSNPHLILNYELEKR